MQKPETLSKKVKNWCTNQSFDQVFRAILRDWMFTNGVTVEELAEHLGFKCKVTIYQRMNKGNWKPEEIELLTELIFPEPDINE